MTSFIPGLFPPTPDTYRTLSTVFKALPLLTIFLWTPVRNFQAMGKTSSTGSKINLPGRWAWALAEAVGPVNMVYILYRLPGKIAASPRLNAATSLFGTGLPVQHEILGFLYVLHYVNRAGVTPLLLAPSMSPIHPSVSVMMVLFQFVNSSLLAGWIVYSARDQVVNSSSLSSSTSSIFTASSVVGMVLFTLGLAGNILAENKLFSLRVGAAKRKAKSEGKSTVTFDKVYVIPPAEGWFRHVLFPHYSLEWLEWLGYWVLGGSWGLGWSYSQSAAAWFLANEIGTMMPRAWAGVDWYRNKFGARAVAGRTGSVPGVI